MKGPLLLFTFQQIILEVLRYSLTDTYGFTVKILVNVSVIPCDSNISVEFMSEVIMASLLMIETLVLGLLTTFVYLR